MKYFTNRLIVGFLLCCVFAVVSVAQMQQRDLQKEAEIQQRLQKIALKTVDTFKTATENVDRGNYQESVELYKEVLAEAPNFEPALRRLGFALTMTGKRFEGLEMNRKAVNLNRTPENLSSLALNLTEPGTDNYKPTQAELEQAFALSKEAMQKKPDDPENVMLVAQLALTTNNIQDFRNAVNLLNAKSPDLAATHYFNGILLANDGDLDAAETEIKQAETLGLPHEAAQEILTAIEQEQSNSFFGLGKYFYYGLYLVGAWAFGLLALFVGGKILSAKTLRSVENSDPNDITGGGQAGLRKIYRKVIGFAGIYYYLSQPVVMLLVIVFTLGVILFFFWLGTIPIKLVLILAFVGLATIFYMVKSLFVREKVEDPGRALSENEAPELWTLVLNVAEAVNTRPVDEIRITHGTELAVYERGGMREKMQDKAGRVLIVGVAVLNGFSQNAFRAVLAHEYGHFSNRDTAGGDIAYRVNSDIIRLAESMGLSGTATFYNISFQFLRLYHFIFRRITHGASRLQEILADRAAAHQYGAEAFREGLSHVIRRDIEFNLIADKEINDALSSNRALQNLYEMTEQNEEIKKDLEQMYNENIARPTTEDDTHPSPQDRFKLISRIKSKETAPISGQVWDLFKNREALTKEMNALLETRIKAMM